MRAALQILQELVKKHGVATLVAAATLDGYRRQSVIDRKNNALNEAKMT
jgi:hypothetical protein